MQEQTFKLEKIKYTPWQLARYMAIFTLVCINCIILIILAIPVVIVEIFTMAFSKNSKIAQYSYWVLTFMGSVACWQFPLILENIGKVQLEFSGDEIPMYENALLIGNHVADTDFFCIYSIGKRLGMFGNIKFLAKYVLKYLPGVGWGMYLLRMVFVKRNWEQDSKTIQQAFNQLRSTNTPIYLASFLEGTRITPEKLKESQEFAKKLMQVKEEGKSVAAYVPKQTMNYVMLPRVKGFIAMLKELARDGYLNYIYDVTFGYSNRNAPVTIQDCMAKDCSNHKICINIKRISIKELPDLNDEKAVTAWCYERWVRKEEILQKFYQQEAIKKQNLKDIHFVGEPITASPHANTGFINYVSKPFKRFFEFDGKSYKNNQRDVEFPNKKKTQ